MIQSINIYQSEHVRNDFSFIVSGSVCWKMALLAFTINNNEKQSGKILSNIWKWELRNVVAAYKWETRFGSWRIDSVNFVCKCNFNKFYYFWVLGHLLQKVWLQNSPPIVGDGVYICIESLKYYDKIYYILLWKKKYTFIVFKFPPQSFTNVLQ